MCQLLCAQAAAATTAGWHWVLMGCDNQLPGPRRGCARRWKHLFCARRWKHLFPQCCVRAQCCPCSNASCVPNQCPQYYPAVTACTGWKSLLASHCNIHPHVQWMGIWLWTASHPAALRELYWSRSLGPMELANTHSQPVSAVWKSLLHVSTSASSHFPNTLQWRNGMIRTWLTAPCFFPCCPHRLLTATSNQKGSI